MLRSQERVGEDRDEPPLHGLGGLRTALQCDGVDVQPQGLTARRNPERAAEHGAQHPESSAFVVVDRGTDPVAGGGLKEGHRPISTRPQKIIHPPTTGRSPLPSCSGPAPHPRSGRSSRSSVSTRSRRTGYPGEDVRTRTVSAYQELRGCRSGRSRITPQSRRLGRAPRRRGGAGARSNRTGPGQIGTGIFVRLQSRVIDPHIRQVRQRGEEGPVVAASAPIETEANQSRRKLKHRPSR